MSSPRRCAGELERAAGLGHVGTMVYGRSGDRFLDDPVYDDFFAAASALGQPVFIHPQLPSPAVRDASYRGFDATTDLALATFGWGWHLDAGLAALRLILRGTFDRHPDLQVVLGHWGEMLLFWLDRADSLSRIAGLQRSVSDYIRSNFFITTSGMLNPALLQHALSVTSIDRLIFSTDYPFQHPTQPGDQRLPRALLVRRRAREVLVSERRRVVRARRLKDRAVGQQAVWSGAIRRCDQETFDRVDVVSRVDDPYASLSSSNGLRSHRGRPK